MVWLLHMQVLSDLLSPAGVQATYYDVLTNGTDGPPMFHRNHQRLDYADDFPAACVTRYLSFDFTIWMSDLTPCSGITD